MVERRVMAAVWGPGGPAQPATTLVMLDPQVRKSNGSWGQMGVFAGCAHCMVFAGFVGAAAVWQPVQHWVAAVG